MFIIALMCLAIPGKIIELNGRSAMVQYPNETRKAFVGETNLKVGDFVMVQMGIIVKVLTEEEAKVAAEAWKQC